ncbi:restriction endonuclease subunit S [Xanthomonas sacchari]|uniref:restriction endonuclease subunit S n=1 Tax=Xanthomonas sacchari TaxID=56458 RepID=UPI00224D3636|nr:restriction endonuclease subunit S [Xanthomonas sacchari]UYK83879.1 restriction endonuclease subunit S [Xanthomonas sacchari]
MSEPQIDIRPDHWAIVRDILQRHVPQHAVWAFGSRAKWTAKEYSDLDLAIITDSPLPLATSAALAEDFSESDLPWKVDIVDWAETSETFRKIIERDRVVVQEYRLEVEPFSAWPECQLRDCATWYSGGTPSKSMPSYWGGDIPWISAKSLIGFFISDSEDRVTEEGVRNGTRLVPEGSILFVVRGMSLKAEFRMGLTTRPVTFNQDLKALVAVDGIESAYLAYAIKSKTAQILQMVGEAGHGTGVLPTDRIQALKIPVPPIEEQRTIARILGTLDDRIELNRRMNETLEAMARSLFNSWFVNFDGVSAQGMQESELKPIPKKWSWEPVSKLIELNPIEPLRKGMLSPYLDMAALPTVGSWPEPPILREYSSGMRFRNGDTLLARITPCLENGKTAFIQCLPENALAWGSTEFIVMRPVNPVPVEYAYLLARDEAFRNHAIQSMTGTSGRQRVQAESIAQFKVAYPDNPAIWQEFAESVSPLFKGIKVNAESTQTLTQLRDTLLPKLISGEVRIKDAERLAETA